MTSQISKQFAAIIVFVFMSVINLHAQQLNADAMLNQLAQLKRIEAMQPDSIGPKYQLALQSLNYAVMNPHAAQTDNVLAQAEQTIGQMEKMKGVDQSNLCTLKGFLLMVRIVQNPAQNGQRYYLDVMQNYEKALKLNPDNTLARQLQEKFLEGMKQATGPNRQ
jgi:tetratricopeptide (TPR) repeat protein